MGLSVMENQPGWEEKVKWANNAGAAQYIAPSHWLGEANVNELGLSDVGSDAVAGLAEGGQITAAITQGITTLGQTFAQLQANKAAGKRNAAAQRPPAQENPGGGGGGGGGDGLLSGNWKTWTLVGGGALLLFILVYSFTKKKKSDVHPVSMNPWF